MHRRAVWIKLSLCLIVLTLVAGLGTIVWLHWFSGGHHPSPPHPSPSPVAAPPPMIASALGGGGANAAAAASLGRALQAASNDTPPPPPPPLPPPPPTTSPPPLFLQPRDSGALGAGVVVLIIVGALACLACAIAIPRSLAVRFCVWTVASLVILATSLVLLLMPRKPPPTSVEADGQLTDLSTIGRIFLIAMATVFACASLGAVAVFHVLAPSKAPLVVEPPPAETYRLKA